jgi:NAD(P)-dependent dehydrogenase (short-subunit alcohol dehydrogenase family)
LITGGTDGLGRAAAVLLAERGYRVFAGGRDAQKLAALDQFAREHKLSLESIALDVCNDDSVDRAVAEIEGRAGPVEILINNAGIAILAAMEEISLDDLRKQYETNVFGAVRMLQRVLPEMRRLRRGRIINMSSVSGKIAFPLYGPYSSSKHALEAISDALRHELYPFAIHVVLIEPGEIKTNIRNAARELSGSYARNADSSPYAELYRAQENSGETTTNRDTPEDCARVILRAVEDAPPRARYVVTRPAKYWVVAKRLLSDRALDRKFRKIFGLDALREKHTKAAQG